MVWANSGAARKEWQQPRSKEPARRRRYEKRTPVGVKASATRHRVKRAGPSQRTLGESYGIHKTARRYEKRTPVWRQKIGPRAKSKPEPFLHEAQKRFGTPRVSIVVWAKSGAARKRWPRAKSKSASFTNPGRLPNLCPRRSSTHAIQDKEVHPCVDSGRICC